MYLSRTPPLMKKVCTHLCILLCFLLSGSFLQAQQGQATENVILITMDGFRWQELFTGADPALIQAKEYNQNPAQQIGKFWHEDHKVRRQLLMPFVWSGLVKNGVLAGNRFYDNKVDLSNKRRFSYPGYNELLTGSADRKIKGNDKKNNSNVTILEYVNQQPGFEGKVAAFGSWDVIPFIINEQRSQIPVNAGYEPAKGDSLSERERLLNELQYQIPTPWDGVRLDAFTYHYAMEYLKRKQPRFLYLAFGETDDFAHEGHYDSYLNAAHRNDQFIRQLWEFIPSSGKKPQITC